ncbi:hypothetical protein M404DRAFT_995718 [Pisolithus tinctorius Marx 270]|uniref:Uncharacterized protein n=1 Tax=Pisolithus tinctorius Marx 270 TaxID=870435 RepID=A0A0C3PPW1_PISTI|nr:hypothetical protein M404DRAFT_995718 [Pisolithus tinctorius Marx 270]
MGSGAGMGEEAASTENTRRIAHKKMIARETVRVCIPELHEYEKTCRGGGLTIEERMNE